MLRSIAAALVAFVASFEFVVTLFFGAILYAWCAIYFAVRVYLNEVRGLFARAVVTWRIRVQTAPPRSLANGRQTGSQPDAQEVLHHGPVGRGRFDSWLN